MDVDVLYSHQKEIHSLFELRHKKEVPLACAVPNGPIPTMPVAGMPKIGISYACRCVIASLLLIEWENYLFSSVGTSLVP